MDGLDVSGLAERLEWEDKEYWLHMEADSPFEKYPAKQHARKVQGKLGVEEGLIYLPGQAAKNNDDSDMPAPFRQLRYFYYLSGCNEPDCHLTYDIRQDTLTLFIPRINPKRVIWNGRGSTPAEALIKYDIDAVFFIDQLAAFVQSWANHSKNQQASIYGVHPSQIPGCPARSPRIDTTSLLPAMNICRMVKDEHEIGLIRKANDISSHAHKEVLANILKFKNEAQVEGLFMDVCISKQAKEQAYDPIAASGTNAGTLHYDANNEDFEDRQLMCLDAGCEFELYASDVTRTFPLASSWPTQEAENVYKLVERMQEACIERLAPGVRYLDLHIRAHQIAIDGLLQLGIFHNGTREEIYKAGTSRAFFPHGLGHHIGLEVHDVGQAELMSIRRGKIVTHQAPSLYPRNFHTPIYDPTTCHAPTNPESSHLEAGMVVTVEPGIYFSAYALQQFYLSIPEHAKFIDLEVLERYMPVGGVRIEDDILITAKGYDNLTTAPKGDEMFDIIRGKVRPDSETPRSMASPRRRSTENCKPLVRAPGLKKTAAADFGSLARAETMPTAVGELESVDFEPFGGPSLFSNYKRSMTTDKKVQEWQQDRKRETSQQRAAMVPAQPVPVCGQKTRHVQHTYLGDAMFLSRLPCTLLLPARGGPCKDCAILVQTLDRLRQNLQSPKLSQPEPVAHFNIDRFERSEDRANMIFAQQQGDRPRPVPVSNGSTQRRNESPAKATNSQQLPVGAGITLHRPDAKAAVDEVKELSAEPPKQPSIPTWHTAYQNAIANLPSHAPPRANSDDERLHARMSSLRLHDQAPTALPTMNGSRAPPTSGVMSPTEAHARATQRWPPPLMSREERDAAWLEHRQADQNHALSAWLGSEEHRGSHPWDKAWGEKGASYF